MLPRQLPDQLLGAGVDGGIVIERTARGRDRYPRELRQILQAGAAARHDARFAANFSMSGFVQRNPKVATTLLKEFHP